MSPCAHCVRLPPPSVQCKLVGDFDYTNAAENCVVNNLCTNRPVKCPLAGCGLAIPSYFMEAHFEAKHGGADKMPASLRGTVALSTHEAELTMQMLKNKTPKMVRHPQAGSRTHARTRPPDPYS